MIYNKGCKMISKSVAMWTILLVIIFAGCTSQPQNIQESKELPKIYPDYIGVTIPIGIAPLDFAMADDSVTTVDVFVKGKGATSLHANGRYADFTIDEWHQLLKENKGGQLTVSVCAEKDGRWTRFSDFTIFVSQEPLSEWGITYRRIPPSYEIYSHMGIFQRDLSTFDETPLLENRQMIGTCLNCHTANRTNPDQYVFHARGDHGATIIHRNGNEELLQSRNDSLGGAMVYPYWHPGGRYCAFSTNKTSQMFHTANPLKRIEVYDSQSDVFVYDTETRTILRDTLIMKKYWAENTPAFSPDGKWLFFTTAKRQLYPTDYDQEKYSLCRVSFNEETGHIGTKVDTLINTLSTGKSVSWPRPSYDGRFLMYTQADYGYFTIWHPEADLWLLDLESGLTRPISEVNSHRAESLHSWSTNSRWFLFTSRRDDGLYSRVYLSYINNQGTATKPFLLPQRDPKQFYRRLMYSYNTPDFTSKPVDTNPPHMTHQLMQGNRISTNISE